MITQDEELAAVQAALAGIGVDGRDLSRFVNRPSPGVIEPESFDAAAAFPVLLAWLPRARDAPVRDTLARRAAQGARRREEKRAAAPILATLLRHEPDESTAWALADALSRVLVPEAYDEFLELASDRSVGVARQLLVYSLWRVKNEAVAATAARELRRLERAA